MSSWGKINTPPAECMNFAEIMSEEYAHRLQKEEQEKYDKRMKQRKETEEQLREASSSYAEKVQQKQPAADLGAAADLSAATAAASDEAAAPNLMFAMDAFCEGDDVNSDAAIAQMLQAQFDREYNEELSRIEQQRNKQSKVTVTLDKFRRGNDMNALLDDADDAAAYDSDDKNSQHKRDWDRFETNDKILDSIPKCGFRINKDGEMITKHDAQLCGVRNACRVMDFPPEFATGDGAGFDMKLSNKVYNQLKTYSRRGNHGSTGKNTPRMHDRKENMATAEMGVDARTRVLLYKLINNQILDEVNGVVSTGKEALILHAKPSANYSPANAELGRSGVTLMLPQKMPKCCAIKIFKTTLNEFKQREMYIKDDYRFKDRISKPGNYTFFNMWAEKEWHNLKRMHNAGINCPTVVIVKQHVLVMSLIGNGDVAAPKLKDARLSEEQLEDAYKEIVAAMHALYNKAQLVHADLSEYNILWHDDKCWFIDVAQAVEPKHPSAYEFLMRDCQNIINFFKKRGLSELYSKEELFEYITGLNAETHNAAQLERIHTRGASVTQATAPNSDECPDALRPLQYPFDLAWELTQTEKQLKAANEAAEDVHADVVVTKPRHMQMDQAANAMRVLNVNCAVAAKAAKSTKAKNKVVYTAKN